MVCDCEARYEGRTLKRLGRGRDRCGLEEKRDRVSSLRPAYFRRGQRGQFHGRDNDIARRAGIARTLHRGDSFTYGGLFQVQGKHLGMVRPQ